MSMTIDQLAEGFGSLDLLTAYIMRPTGCSQQVAEDYVVDLDISLEQILYERVPDKVSYVCRCCGQEFVFDQDDVCGDGSFHPDGEELLWGHIQNDHPDVFNAVCDLETPYMIEECYEEVED